MTDTDKILKQGRVNAAILLIYIAYCSIIISISANNNNTQQTYELSYKDNISNPENSEFVTEVIFNHGKDNVQMNFCYRYYDTLDEQSKEWFRQQLK